MPDLRTLQWAAEQLEVDPARLAAAIAHDVPLRVDVPPGMSHEIWQAAADAAYEATWWPLLRAAKRLRSGHGQVTES
ncbi:MAG TPA: hypothetical protein VF174_04805 [Micromonosporaceae bacterium]